MSENQGFQDFTAAYAKLLVAVWTDEKVADRLKSDPHAVAADAGLVIPADVAITVSEVAGESSGEPQAAMEAYYGDFQKGLADKAVTLAVPQAPALDAQDLTSDDLAEVAGGMTPPRPPDLIDSWEGGLVMSSAITVSGLRKAYGSFVAVDNVDLQVESGEVFAFLGPNGAGKTTTIDILTGAQRRTSGTVSVLGRDPQNDEREWRAQVGVVPQGTAKYSDLTVREIIDHFAAFYPDPFPTGQLIDMVGLGPKAKVLSTKLSGGQRRRLDVAVGVVGRPRLLFLDEPTTGLDPEARREAWELVRLLTGTGMTTVLTTHYLDEAQELSQRAGIIIRGKIVHVGTLSELARLTGRRYRVSYDLDPLVEVPLSLAERMKSQPHSCLYGTDEPTALLRLLLDAAQRHGIAEIPGLQITQPSLEQIYINMVEQAKEHR